MQLLVCINTDCLLCMLQECQMALADEFRQALVSLLLTVFPMHYEGQTIQLFTETEQDWLRDVSKNISYNNLASLG